MLGGAKMADHLVIFFRYFPVIQFFGDSQMSRVIPIFADDALEKTGRVENADLFAKD